MTDASLLREATVSNVESIGPFDFRWPNGMEHFESGWNFELTIGGETHEVRHGIGRREVYGRERVHTVTWLDGRVQVEGVEADDYPGTGALVSLLRHSDKKMIKSIDEVPADYEGFNVVEHLREIEAKWSRDCLAVKIGEEDLVNWGIHALIRVRQQGASAPQTSRTARIRTMVPPILPPAPTLEKQAVAAALIAHGDALAQSLGSGATRFTADNDANALIHHDPFAFLVAVIADQGIRAERAWALPRQLQLRLGGFSPELIASNPESVRAAFAAPPELHRFINDVAAWTIAAAVIVIDLYRGNAGEIWSGDPTAAELRQRFDDFPGIGQKKAAMAVEILERDLGVKIKDLSGSDVAYDVHLRRVFLRTGIAERDDLTHMVFQARVLHPERPGELDKATWDIGRRWCKAKNPECANCPLVSVCPRHIERGDQVRSI